jgi:hypothetical protein
LSKIDEFPTMKLSPRLLSLPNNGLPKQKLGGP